jgi:hypothetical protein
MMKPARLVMTTLCALFGAMPFHALHAHEGHDHQTHAAHEHGVATLRVASADKALVIEFLSPLDNLVGFEHEPRSDEQRKAIADAEALLRDGAALFRLPAAAGCQLLGAKLDSPWLQSEQPDHDHGHGHSDAHGATEHEGHADLAASYRFECTAPDRLDSLHVRLFDSFPRLREVRVERATASGQGAAVLTPAKAELPL